MCPKSHNHKTEVVVKGKGASKDVSFWDQRASQIRIFFLAFFLVVAFLHRLDGEYCRKEDSKFMVRL